MDQSSFDTPKMKSWLVVLLACFALSEAVSNQVWEAFKKAHGKSYTGNEESVRRVIWEKNVKLIQEHNLEYDLGLHTFTLGLNEYADWTSEEFGKFTRGLKAPNATGPSSTFLLPTYTDLPDTVDWRTKGYVTPIKNQKQCGSCWAFSTTGSLEGQHFKKTGKLVSLSEQNLVDCSKAEGNEGCNGGWMDWAFNYIQKNGGIDTEESYPYEGKDGKCRYDPANIGATCTGHTDIPHKNETALQEAVATVGPISVAIDASSEKFQLYKTGVYVDNQCSQTLLDHGVLAVGYGTQDSQAYWLVKNSWGESWGDKGYIMMARNHNNMCGIATKASYPLV